MNAHTGFDPAGRHEALEAAVAALKSMAHAARLQILCLLLEGPMPVGALAETLGEAQASVSQHLIRLRAEGVLRAERRGKQVLYRLADARIVPVIAALRQGYCAAGAGSP